MFTSVAAAVSRTQRLLDERLPYRPALAYHLRKVDISARFGATQTQGGIFFWVGHSSRQDQEHIVKFSLLPTQSTALEGTALTSGQIAVRAPALLVPPTERTDIVVELINFLAHGGSRFQDEVSMVKEALAKAKDDPGLTMLRLTAQRMLIVRLGGVNDGIFLRDTSTNPRYTVFSYMGADEDQLLWTPFGELFAVFRQWQLERCPLVPIGGLSPPPRLGSIEVARFGDELGQAAASARQEVVPLDPHVYPVHYVLRNLSTDLAYSVARGTDPEEAAAASLIRSVARVQVDGGPPKVHLLSPEWILTGAQRSAFFDLFDDFLQLEPGDKRGIWKHLAKEYISDYRRSLLDGRRRSNAIVVLSYRGKVPVNQFLVIWTGTISDAGLEGEERDFAFRVTLDGKCLVFNTLTLPLEDPVHPWSAVPSVQKQFASAQVEYNADHPGLHDFFHASWIWDLAGDWYASPKR
jgi:hypothetical protein